MPSIFGNGMVLISAQAELIMNVRRTQALNIKSNTERYCTSLKHKKMS